MGWRISVRLTDARVLQFRQAEVRMGRPVRADHRLLGVGKRIRLCHVGVMEIIERVCTLVVTDVAG